ncbi:hypothetical protein PROFUN_02326 [Planoprotostelium fungivorum]|uniref:Uncharacterized protein n=1 Tax=Planoprotostelium fungivorum TaxID=1890364 RepID=A0A2P6NYQ4_9EUKA|nr:hypothetical protein PROFUN_02326 [Planoprotostelium fungivorum]
MERLHPFYHPFPLSSTPDKPIGPNRSDSNGRDECPASATSGTKEGVPDNEAEA